MKCSKLAFLALAAVAICGRAEHLGTLGPIYPIAEENAIEMILGKLRDKERDGSLKKLQQEAVKRSINSIKNIPPVDGIGVVSSYSHRLVDPTVHYPRAVTTDEGRVVVPAGSKVNPLLITGLTKRLVFFDGRDPAQVAAVRKLVQKERARVKPILIAGSWFDLTKTWKSQVYFDQHGTLSRRFGIKAVPTVVSQQGAALLVQEVPAKELR